MQSTVVDVTLRKLYEEKLRYQANFDQITDLPNRVLALDRLKGVLSGARRHGHKVGLLFMDIDHFKKINDTHGHATGDRFLAQAAERIVACVREEDTVARLSGDEFAVVLSDIRNARDTEPVAHKILNAFSRPFILDGQEAFVGASIGIALGPDDGDDPELLLRNADAAMYEAKEQGRHTFRYFTRELNERAVERVRIEARMHRGLDEDAFEIRYQPLVEVRSGRIIGAEALVRWNDPELGRVKPSFTSTYRPSSRRLMVMASGLVRKASRKRSFASCNAALACLRAVMSSMVPAMLSGTPAVSKVTSPCWWTSRSDPSAQTIR